MIINVHIYHDRDGYFAVAIIHNEVTYMFGTEKYDDLSEKYHKTYYECIDNVITHSIEHPEHNFILHLKVNEV